MTDLYRFKFTVDYKSATSATSQYPEERIYLATSPLKAVQDSLAIVEAYYEKNADHFILYGTVEKLNVTKVGVDAYEDTTNAVRVFGDNTGGEYKPKAEKWLAIFGK